LYLSKGKRTFADIGGIGELFADFWHFNSERLVNGIIDDILEEEGGCTRRVVVCPSGVWHVCYV